MHTQSLLKVYYFKYYILAIYLVLLIIIYFHLLILCKVRNALHLILLIFILKCCSLE